VLRARLVHASLCLAVLTASLVAAASDGSQYWPQWRGPTGNGGATQATPPVEWDEARNIRWKIPIPGMGHASPIVWEDRVYILTAAESPTDESAVQYRILALSRETGDVVWDRTAREASPHEGRHETNTHASGSPITDGERVYAPFGSAGLYCYDMDGTPLWDVDLGDMRKLYEFGEAASPALYGDRLVVV